MAIAVSILIGMILTLQVIVIMAFSFIDLRKKLPALRDHSFVSFIIPVYNDGNYIVRCIESIYSSCEKDFEVIVINDHSTDNTYEELKMLKKRHKFRLFNNDLNKGKVISINEASENAKGDILFVLDSDTILNRTAFEDVMRRFQSDSRIAGVSCGTVPSRKGFMQEMQAIEHNFITLFQAAMNVYSTIGMRGACMAVRKDAFEKVGRFSVNALTEDSDMAIKLNKANYKVHQSLAIVKSNVPNSIVSWVKQKIRWGAGYMQQFMKYPEVYLTNPVFVLFVLLAILPIIINLLVGSAFNIFPWVNEFSLMNSLLVAFLLYPLITIPYYLFKKEISAKEFYNVLMVYPYNFLYLPPLVLIYTFAYFKGIYLWLTLSENDIGWKG